MNMQNLFTQRRNDVQQMNFLHKQKQQKINKNQQKSTKPNKNGESN